jgi:hypothetical protein
MSAGRSGVDLARLAIMHVSGTGPRSPSSSMPHTPACPNLAAARSSEAVVRETERAARTSREQVEIAVAHEAARVLRVRVPDLKALHVLVPPLVAGTDLGEAHAE